MKVIECDRCKVRMGLGLRDWWYVAGNDQRKVWSDVNPRKSFEWELCPECYASLLEWMDYK